MAEPSKVAQPLNASETTSADADAVTNDLFMVFPSGSSALSVCRAAGSFDECILGSKNERKMRSGFAHSHPSFRLSLKRRRSERRYDGFHILRNEGCNETRNHPGRTAVGLARKMEGADFRRYAAWRHDLRVGPAAVRS
ncbi:hypothetical protein PSAB6_10272 [Paraburkholderia sabiae]|nr:hypothetical protein PSAB6_10272 [Paraburkholderia sabiae]